MYQTFKQNKKMTIQVKIAQKELNHKFNLVKNFAKLISCKNSEIIFNYSRYIERLNLINDMLQSGNYEEIYSDLYQIEKELLEIV